MCSAALVQYHSKCQGMWRHKSLHQKNPPNQKQKSNNNNKKKTQLLPTRKYVCACMRVRAHTHNVLNDVVDLSLNAKRKLCISAQTW